MPIFSSPQLKLGVSENGGFDDSVRIVQLTPPGSACSIVLATGLHLVVGDVSAARAALIERGVEVGEIDEHDQGIKYAAFSDPDGNTWTLQEMPWSSSEFLETRREQ